MTPLVETAARVNATLNGPSITYWVRGEPDARSDATDSMVEPLQARVRDPLWFLTRQWQLGEFMGADSGSPAYVELTERTGRMAGWSVAGGPVAPLAAAAMESLAEPEPFSPDVATRVELGQVFEQLLTERGLGALVPTFRTAYAVSEIAADPSDMAEVRYRLVVGGRAIDGIALTAAADAALPDVPAVVPPVPTANRADVLAALAGLKAWITSTIGATGTSDPVAWNPGRLEYSLDAAASAPGGGTITFTATPGADGLLDWSAFDLASPALTPASGIAPAASSSAATPATMSSPATRRAVIPTHVRFRGAPNARFWDFELSGSDLGSIVPDKRDLARLAVMDFVLVHANDWFVIPIDVAPGGLHQIDQLLVHDVFGVATLVQRADREPESAGRWSMFTTSVAGQPVSDTAGFFVLPPSAASSIQLGTVLEEVRFARDDMANMVWALEQSAENALGAPWSGHERDIARNVPPPGGVVPPPPLPPGVQLRYEIESRVPEHWIPFLPISIDPVAGSVALERAAMLRADGTPIEPAGRILRPSSIAAGSPYRVPEEEVARIGVRVQRVVARCRWTDGSTALWVMRRRAAIGGEVTSALRFDQALLED